uniref:Uncharacterized protein n=1 Tax=Timema monikensis TaxID=170555 RepID=A0A7R9DZY6_9NEOP|nr:unnamed protein product [Timema monikensis]
MKQEDNMLAFRFRADSFTYCSQGLHDGEALSLYSQDICAAHGGINTSGRDSMKRLSLYILLAGPTRQAWTSKATFIQISPGTVVPVLKKDRMDFVIQEGPRKSSPPPISSRHLTLNWRRISPMTPTHTLSSILQMNLQNSIGIYVSPNVLVAKIDTAISVSTSGVWLGIWLKDSCDSSSQHQRDTACHNHVMASGFKNWLCKQQQLSVPKRYSFSLPRDDHSYLSLNTSQSSGELRSRWHPSQLGGTISPVTRLTPGPPYHTCKWGVEQKGVITTSLIRRWG